MTRPPDDANASAPVLTPLCAIGASAGGIEALQAFFEALPRDLGLAYVVVVHLSPDHPSQLAEILAARTAMPVREAGARTALAPDHVYVVAPDHQLSIADDDLVAATFGGPEERHTPIDRFLRSVAAARADAVAILLSGAGTDGTLGARAIREAGGVVFVQEPREAAYPSMPGTALAAGAADVVAPVGALAEHLRDLVRHRRAAPVPAPAEPDDALGRLVRLLRLRTGHDFSSYKPATIRRRATRRMQMTHSADLAAYVDLLRDTPAEADRLFKDLLISVTTFFRDPAAFDALAREVIPRLFDGRGTDDPVRVWVVGCATGEEAYSVAMLLIEEAERRESAAPVQIFATELDDAALAVAREGRYPRTVAADVTPARLHRFFTAAGDHYVVKKEVRDLVLFTHHSVLKDPPFLRLDLVCCRNLLIYLERHLQRELASLFHYALEPEGHLFLGTAETIDAPDLFAPVDSAARLYRTRPDAARRLRVPTLPSYSAAATAGGPARPDATPPPAVGTSVAHLSALEREAPPSVLVDEYFRVLHLSPGAGRFFSPAAGAFSSELASLIRPELRVDLRSGLQRAFEKRETTVTLPLAVAFDGEQRRIVLHVRPAGEADGKARALVFFIDGGRVTTTDGEIDADEGVSATLVHDLRLELQATQERLQASREQHQETVQELRAANEELQSINEEYRSTSEELETSKEELQSMNEELQTVNAELRAKLATISSANSDLQNLIQATEIGTLFLDTGLRIRMFTPPVAELFNIAAGDVGRAITDFSHRLLHADIERDAAVVLRELTPLEKEVKTRDDRWLTMRLRPYRTVDDRIDGVVLTFVDVTDRRRAEAARRESEEKYRGLFESAGEGVLLAEVVRDDDGRAVDIRYLEANPAALAEVPVAFLGRRLSEVAPAFEPHWWEIPARVARTGEPERHELLAAPLERWYEVYVWKVPPHDDRVAIVFRDTTERRREAEALEATRDLLALATAASGLGWVTLDPGNGTMRLDRRGREILGLADATIPLADFLARVDDADRAAAARELDLRALDGQRFDLTCRVRRDGDGARRVRLTGVFDAAGDPKTARATALLGDTDTEPAFTRR